MQTMFEILLGVSVGMIIAFYTKTYLSARKISNQRRLEYESMEKNKCVGAHSWVSMRVRGGDTHVCKDCGFVPAYDAFVPRASLNAELETVKFRKKFEEYRESKLKEIAEKNGISSEQADSIAQDIFNIKKQFSIDYISQKVKELKEKSQENSDV